MKATLIFSLAASALAAGYSSGPRVTILLPGDGGSLASIAPVRISGTVASGGPGKIIQSIDVLFRSSDGVFDTGKVRAEVVGERWEAMVGPLPNGPGTVIVEATSSQGSIATASHRVEVIPNVSRLWGASGELWEGPSKSRLPDFSYAGYRASEVPIPDRPQVVDVTSAPFLAKAGDPAAADSNTKAFNQAIDAASNGAVFVPAGIYHVGGMIQLRKSGVILRGAVDASGAVASTIHFTHDLTDLNGGVHRRVFSWLGGLVDVRPADVIRWDTVPITSDRRRGDNTVDLDSATGFAPGMPVVLRITDPGDGSFLAHVHNNVPIDIPSPENTMAPVLEWPCQIAEVRGNRVRLTQPLRLDLRRSWKPVLLRTKAESPGQPIREVGIEHLRLKFTARDYEGHHAEKGRNAINFGGDVVDSWIRDIEIENADSGILINQRCKWITVRDIRFDSDRGPRARSSGYEPGDPMAVGHHGILLSRAADVLVRSVDFRGVNFTHELTVSHQASGNVFADIRRTAAPVRAEGLRIDLDHHRDWPFENLFTNFAGGVVSSFQTSGSISYGPQSGARGTFWGIGATVSFGPSGFAYPPDRSRSILPNGPRSLDWGKIQTNFVGRFVSESKVPVQTDLTSPRQFFEPIDELAPRDLHQSQLEYRLTKQRGAIKQ